MALNFGRLSIGPETIGPQRTAGKDRGVKPTGYRRGHAPVFICFSLGVLPAIGIENSFTIPGKIPESEFESGRET